MTPQGKINFRKPQDTYSESGCSDAIIKLKFPSPDHFHPARNAGYSCFASKCIIIISTLLTSVYRALYPERTSCKTRSAQQADVIGDVWKGLSRVELLLQGESNIERFGKIFAPSIEGDGRHRANKSIHGCFCPVRNGQWDARCLLIILGIPYIHVHALARPRKPDRIIIYGNR